MRLFELIKIWEPAFEPQLAKVHLACPTGVHDPLEVYKEGGFDEWQRWQNARNFGRPYVVALVDAGQRRRWLFAGLYRPLGTTPVADPWPHYLYDLERLPSCDEWRGRLFVSGQYKARNSYPKGETLAQDLEVVQLLEEPLSIGDFPGFKDVDLPRRQLDILVRENNQSWRAALSSVNGVYLITDPSNGKLYVGKADGADGIWGRWCCYSATTHGGNVALRKEFGIETTADRAQDLRFSILEIADLHTLPSDIQDRESHWKRILGSRVHGYNRN